MKSRKINNLLNIKSRKNKIKKKNGLVIYGLEIKFIINNNLK